MLRSIKIWSVVFCSSGLIASLLFPQPAVHPSLNLFNEYSSQHLTDDRQQCNITPDLAESLKFPFFGSFTVRPPLHLSSVFCCLQTSSRISFTFSAVTTRSAFSSSASVRSFRVALPFLHKYSFWPFIRGIKQYKVTRRDGTKMAAAT